MSKRSNYYITAQDQVEMCNLLHQYLALSKNGTVKSMQADRVIGRLFGSYIDKIINGVLISYKSKFRFYPDQDELFQEARIAVLSSINKRQWDPQRGDIFNFFSTVIIRNLTNYTLRKNRKIRGGEMDVAKFENTMKMSFDANYEKEYFFDELVALLKEYFENDNEYVQLCYELVDYFMNKRGERFTKREFSEFIIGRGYSSTLVNSFFSLLKRARWGNRAIDEFFVITIETMEQKHEDTIRNDGNRKKRARNLELE